jgi:hypothetical protein
MFWYSRSQAGPTRLSDLNLALLYILLHATLASRKAADNARCTQRSGSFSLMDPPLLCESAKGFVVLAPVKSMTAHTHAVSSHKGPSDSRLGYLRSSSTRYCGAASSFAPCSTLTRC